MSKVYEDNYEIIAADDIAYVFKSGDVLKLENSYCREIFSQGKTIALSEVEGVQGLQIPPFYAANTIEFYINAPICNNGSIWGTLNISSVTVRPKKFSTSEIRLVEECAEIIGRSLSD